MGDAFIVAPFLCLILGLFSRVVAEFETFTEIAQRTQPMATSGKKCGESVNLIHGTSIKLEIVILGKAKGRSRGSRTKFYLKLDPRLTVEDDKIFTPLVSIFYLALSGWIRGTAHTVRSYFPEQVQDRD
jgi:hypothetical protein